MHDIFRAIASASRKEKADFFTEIETMKKITEGNNPHIVNMIGCVTRQEPIVLMTEFVQFGDLLSYLRSQQSAVSLVQVQSLELLLD